MIQIPAKQIPPFNYAIAQQNGIKKIMMATWGGVGDQVVAEPTLRYAFKLFEGYEISLISSFAELFMHLPWKSVYKPGSNEAMELRDDDWLVIHTHPKVETLARDFLAHTFIQPVDFCSLCAFQRQLPVRDRAIQLHESDLWMSNRAIEIAIHPGRNWSSKTFPKAWWDELIAGFAQYYPHRVAIIGQDVSAATGTVDVEVPDTVFDMRNKLSLTDLSGILKRARVVVTNDSAPLHIAAAGHAYIFFVSSCKEPDHLMHWRSTKNGNVVFGWRMEDFGRDGLWNHQSSCPVREKALSIDVMDEQLMQKVLPHPLEIVNRTRMII